MEGSLLDIFVMDLSSMKSPDKVDLKEYRGDRAAFSIWIRAMVRDTDLEWGGCSKLGSQRTYAASHLLFELTAKPLLTGLRMVGFSLIAAAGPVDVEAKEVDSGPS